MHKDLSDSERGWVEKTAAMMACQITKRGDSLSIAREAWLNAFDKAAEELGA